MKELFSKLPHDTLENARTLPFLDTCFFIHQLEHHAHAFIKQLTQEEFYLTSFNVEEFLHNEPHFKHEIKVRCRDLLHAQTKLRILDIPVSPGNAKEEMKFTNMVDENLLSHIHDPSDAVLVATAIQAKSSVYTHDKRHLFTAELNNYLREKKVAILHSF